MSKFTSHGVCETRKTRKSQFLVEFRRFRRFCGQDVPKIELQPEVILCARFPSRSLMQWPE
jgi:hypothetical protein